jgi:electron transport complex protein RnfG
VSKEASKDGGEVQAITAATISSRAFIEVVNNAYRIANGHDATTAATSINEN